MHTADQEFIAKLQGKARQQALIEQSSPLPVWSRPFLSIVGLHYWQFLLVVSSLLAVIISIWFFPTVYENFYRL